MEKPLLLPKAERLALVAGAGQFREVIDLSIDLCSSSRLRLNFDGCLEVRCPPHAMVWMTLFWGNGRGPKSRHCKPIKPRFQVNDLLWCKEKFFACEVDEIGVQYCVFEDEIIEGVPKPADFRLIGMEGLSSCYKWGWHSPCNMKKEFARHWFKVKSVKCEQSEGVWYFVYNLER